MNSSIDVVAGTPTNPEGGMVPTGGDVFKELVVTYERYVKLSDGASVALAAWTLFAHAHDAFKISPILTVSSPEKRCGKTTLLEVIGGLAPISVTTSHITTAAIFRLIEAQHPTLIIDEGDAFIKGNEDMRGVLNSGHTRHSAFIYRTKSETYEPVKFSTWCPKVIALIGSLPGTLMDRSVVIPMRRKFVGEVVEKLRCDEAAELFTPLREKCAAWASEKFESLKTADPMMPGWLNDRAADNWRPLIAIAELAGGDWPEQLTRAIAQLVEHDDDLESMGVQLLIDLRDTFASHGVDRLTTSDILSALCALGHKPWQTYSRGFPISERQIARLLKPFGIAPKTIRVSKGAVTVGADTLKGYVLADFEDAFVRYLPHAGADATEAMSEEELREAIKDYAGATLLRCDGHFTEALS